MLARAPRLRALQCRVAAPAPQNDWARLSCQCPQCAQGSTETTEARQQRLDRSKLALADADGQLLEEWHSTHDRHAWELQQQRQHLQVSNHEYLCKSLKLY
jgi:hypothetical protein